MATLREIRKRIESAANIRKITQTMERISAVRVLRTNLRLEQTRHYANSLKEMAADLFYTAVQEENSFRDICLLQKRKKIRSRGLLVITSNQGMCGGFNHNVLQEADRVYRQCSKEGFGIKVFAIGKKALQHFTNRGIKVELGCDQYADKFTYEDINPMSQMLIHSTITGELDEIFLVYNHLESISCWHPVTESLLPCDEFMRNLNDPCRSRPRLFTCESNVHEVIRVFLPELVINRLFQAILESIVAEHISRRLAMQQASTSAKDMITEMRNLYHALRKSKITRELNEIMGTVLALQRD